MKRILKLFGLMKLLIYKYFLGYKIYFDKTVFLHPSVKINFKAKTARIYISSNVIIEENCKIICNRNASLFIEAGVTIREFSYLEICTDAMCKIDERAFLNRLASIVCTRKIIIGKHVAIGNNVSFFDHDHEYIANETQNWEKSIKGEIIIERDVWIGANSTILRNTHIGNNCVIGAMSLVKGNIQENSLFLQKKEIQLRKME